MVQVDGAVAAATNGSRLVLVISASVSKTSRSERLGDWVAESLGCPELSFEHLRLRDLPPEALLSARTDDPAIARAVERVAEATGLVVVTPTYKATYSGLLKVFLDLLPQYALRGKTVLPVATGGTNAHVLMLDAGLRPVLQSMWPRHVTQGCFVLDSQLVIDGEGRLHLDEKIQPMLQDITQAFRTMLALAA